MDTTKESLVIRILLIFLYIFVMHKAHFISSEFQNAENSLFLWKENLITETSLSVMFDGRNPTECDKNLKKFRHCIKYSLKVNLCILIFKNDMHSILTKYFTEALKLIIRYWKKICVDFAMWSYFYQVFPRFIIFLM